MADKKEYIERGALRERLEIVSVVADDLYGMGINAGLDRADKEVFEMPAADVVEVVRCKDCVKRNTADCAMWFNCMKCGGQWSWESDNGFAVWAKGRSRHESDFI